MTGGGDRRGRASPPRERLRRVLAPVLRTGPEPATAHAITSRLAVLLRGGIPTSRVFDAVAREEQGAVAEEARRVADRIATGRPPARALAESDGPEWRLLAAAWTVAESSGAPLADALDQLAAALRGLEELRERRSVLLSAPRATVRLVSALPALAVLFGALLGFDPLGVLLTPVGAVIVVVGSGLLSAGVAWANSLTREVERADRVSGAELVLVRIALGGGRTPDAAMRLVADGAAQSQAEWIPLDALRSGGPVRAVLDSSAAIGAPAGSLLAAEAAGARARAQAELERDAERLGVRVLLPLGACVLPSFVVLGVLPVLISMLGGLGIA